MRETLHIKWGMVPTMTTNTEYTTVQDG